VGVDSHQRWLVLELYGGAHGWFCDN